MTRRTGANGNVVAISFLLHGCEIGRAPAMAMRFNPAPGGPPAPDGWNPPQGWQPPPDWPPAPPGWAVLVDDAENGHLDDEEENGTFEAGASRPWYKKKRYLIPSGTLVAILAIAALTGDPDEPPPTSTAVEATTEAEEPDAEAAEAEAAEAAAQAEADAEAAAEREAQAAADAEREAEAAAEAEAER